MSKKPSKIELKQMALDRRILEAATDTFAANGFESTKVAQIAKEAKVAVGTIYLRYPNKAALLGGVLRQCEQRYIDAMTRKELLECLWPERFYAMFGSLMEAASTDEHLAHLMPIASYAIFEEWMPGDGVRKLIASFVTDGQAKGIFRKEVHADVFAGIAHGMVEGSMQMMMRENPPQPELIVNHLAEAAERFLMV